MPIEKCRRSRGPTTAPGCARPRFCRSIRRPSSWSPPPPSPGGEVILAGEGFGPQPGQVLVHVGGRELEGEILGWYDLGVRWTLPKLAIAGPTEAEVIVVRGDGAAANPLRITITP